MTGAELKQAALRLYGPRAWQKQLAAALGIDVATVRRHTTLDQIPGPVAAAVSAWLEHA